MSFRAAAWAISNRDVETPYQKLVLIVLADCHNDETGRCDPSIDFIAERALMSRRSVERALSALQDRGLIVREQRTTSQRLKTSNAYRLLIPDASESRIDTSESRIDASESRIDASEGRSRMRQRGGVGCVTVTHKPGSKNQEGRTGESLPGIPDAGASEPDICPHQQIIDLYHRTLPDLPKVRAWTGEREKALRARWREKPKRQDLEFWWRFFDYVSKSDFLMGRVESDRPFRATLAWLVKAENFAKVIEGNYHR